MKMLNKKAAISIEFIIILIILVVSFVVILLFYYSFDWKGEIDKEACHQSVIYKATVPALLEKKLVELPLNCKTEKICITDSFGTGACDREYSGEKYQTIRVSSNKDKRDEEINKIITDKLYECWWMMGQGKVQLYSRDFSKKKICTICTRIVFGKDLQAETKKITGLSKYLTRHNIPNSEQTYWMFLTNSNSNDIYNYSEERDFITTKPHAIIFAEVDSGAWLKWISHGAGTIGGAVAAGFVIGSIVPGPGSVIGAGIGGLIGFFGTGGTSEKIDKFFNKDKIATAWQLVDYDIAHLKKLDCASFDGKL